MAGPSLIVTSRGLRSTTKRAFPSGDNRALIGRRVGDGRGGTNEAERGGLQEFGAERNFRKFMARCSHEFREPVEKHLNEGSGYRRADVRSTSGGMGRSYGSRLRNYCATTTLPARPRRADQTFAAAAAATAAAHLQ